MCAGAHELTYKQRNKQTNTQNKANKTQHNKNTVSTDNICNTSDSLKPSNHHFELAASEHGVTASSNKPVINHESTQSYIPENL
jgi:hypothetical protein